MLAAVRKLVLCEVLLGGDDPAGELKVNLTVLREFTEKNCCSPQTAHRTSHQCTPATRVFDVCLQTKCSSVSLRKQKPKKTTVITWKHAETVSQQLTG